MDSEMQAAYQEFMLGKSKSSVPTPLQEESHRSSDGNSSSKRKSGYRPILKAFQGRLEEWKDTNRQLEGVLGSIVNLRDRVYWESSRLEALSVATPSKEERDISMKQQQKQRQSSWRDCGFRSILCNQNSSGALLEEDIHLALNHDLLQHERMLSTLRSLLASLAQTVDDIGRRLDEWMLQNLSDYDDYVSEERMSVAQIKEQNALELAQEIYSLLASDLYSKQKMATRVFNSCHDGVLVRGDADISNDSFWKTDPRDVVKKASKGWPGPENRDLTWNLVHKLLSVS